MIEFDAPKEMSSMIKVVGVGGGGSNAVNHMFSQGIKGVDFIICNTDAQALDASPIPNKIQLGAGLTGGRGAGAIPEVGKNAAIENIDELKEILENNTEMLFITAGMGGGTGTGAAPIIASVAKEMGILTVGIVTIPFKFEGRKRRMQAELGIEELRKSVDTLLIISNDKLREMHGNLTLTEAFGKADNILTDAARGIAEIITVTGYVNVDIEDVKTVMRNSGVAIMGTGIARGENRAIEAVEMALASPLLNDNNIHGASNILLFMASGVNEIEMDEVSTITDYIQDEAGMSADIIWGNGTEESLGDAIRVTVVATGFASNSHVDNTAKTTLNREPQRVVHNLATEQEVPQVKNQPKAVETEDDGMRLYVRPVAPVNTPSEVVASVASVQVSQMQAPQMNEELEEEPLFELSLDDAFELTVSNSAPEVEPKVETVQPKITIYSLDNDQTEVINKNEHDLNLQAIKEQAPEVNQAFRDKASERIAKLKNMSRSYLVHDNLVEMENTPAYIRRGIALNDTAPSADQKLSRYTLDPETGEIRSNTFLHDNVD